MSKYIGPASFLSAYFIVAFRVQVIQTGKDVYLSVVCSKN